MRISWIRQRIWLFVRCWGLWCEVGFRILFENDGKSLGWGSGHGRGMNWEMTLASSISPEGT